MFVNNVAFLVTMSRKIKFLTVKHLKSRSAKQLVHSLKNVMRLYGRNNQHVTTILTDMEFTSVTDPLLGKKSVNTTAAKEHVAEIERSIQTIKERGRAVVSTLPFDVLPKLISFNIIKFGVFFLNTFPAKNGCSEVLSPHEVVTQMKIASRNTAGCRLVPTVRSTKTRQLQIPSRPVHMRALQCAQRAIFRAHTSFSAYIKGRPNHDQKPLSWILYPIC